MATREEILAYVNRDWGAAERVAREQATSLSATELAELAYTLRKRGLALDGPATDAERRRDMATHRRVHRALARVKKR